MMKDCMLIIVLCFEDSMSKHPYCGYESYQKGLGNVLPAHKGIIKKPLKTNLPGFEPMLWKNVVENCLDCFATVLSKIRTLETKPINVGHN